MLELEGLSKSGSYPNLKGTRWLRCQTLLALTCKFLPILLQKFPFSAFGRLFLVFLWAHPEGFRAAVANQLVFQWSTDASRKILSASLFFLSKLFVIHCSLGFYEYLM